MSARALSKEYFENYMKVSYFYNGLHLGNDNLLVTSATQVQNRERLQVQIWESLAARQGQRSPLKSFREEKERI